MANEQLIQAASNLEPQISRYIRETKAEIDRATTPPGVRVAKLANKVLTWPVRKLLDTNGGYGSIIYVAPKEVRGVGVAVVQQLNIRGEAEIRQTDGLVRTVGADEAPRQYGKHNWFGIKAPWASVMGWVDTRAGTPVIESQVQPEVAFVGPVKQTISAAVEHPHPALTISRWKNLTDPIQYGVDNVTNITFNRQELHDQVRGAQNLDEAAAVVSGFQARHANQVFNGVMREISGYNVLGTVAEVAMPAVSSQFNDAAEARGEKLRQEAEAAGYALRRQADAQAILTVLKDGVGGGIAAAVLDKLTR